MDNKTHAILTQAHYNVDKYDRAKAKKKIEKHIKDTGYKLEELHRGVARFRDDNGNNIVSIKGTNVANVKDLVSDIKLGLGVSSKDAQFEDRRKQVSKIYKKIGDEKVQIAGHSLGGSIATSILAKDKDIRTKTDKAHLFNTGYTHAFHKELRESTPKHVRQELRAKITQHHVAGDVISEQMKGGVIGTIQHHEKEESAHSLTNFI
jgi:hypothetical protein